MKKSLLLCVLLLCAGARYTQAVSYGVNLIANADAEAGSSSSTGAQVPVPNWTTTGAFTVIPYGASGGYPAAGDPGPADRSSQFFAGGNGALVSTATQEIDLTANASDIATGNVAFDLSGWFGGFSSDRDHARLTIAFYNGATKLGTVEAGPVRNSERGNQTGLFFRQSTGRLPANTTRVVLTQLMMRTDGSSNDGYADSLSLTLTLKAGAPTVTSSTFAGNGTRADATAGWNTSSHWSPMQVPNNTADNVFDANITGVTLTVPLSNDMATVSSTFGKAQLDVDATVRNLTLSSGGLSAGSFGGRNLTVLGSTTDQTSSIGGFNSNDLGFSVAPNGGDSTLSLGNLTNFSGSTLTSTRMTLSSQFQEWPATIRFNGANIVTLQAVLDISGAFSRITDENGNDALRNLAVIGGNGSIRLTGQDFTTAGNLTLDGSVGLSGFIGGPITFTVNGALTNFDSATHTLTGSRINLQTDETSFPTSNVTFRFNNADIVNNGASISLFGPTCRILDQNGLDGLRNLAHNLAEGTLFLSDRDFSSAGNFTNDGSLTVTCQKLATNFVVNGSLGNYDSTTHTLSGGEFRLFGSSSSAVMATLRFNGADIVHNASSITLGSGAAIRDQSNNDGLRNFVDNQSGGLFELNGQSFVAPSDFTNSGNLYIFNFDPSQIFSVPAGHSFIQMDGVTDLGFSGILTAPNTFLRGGIIHDGGTINGNVTVENGTLAPTGAGGGGVADFQGFILVVPGSLDVPGPAAMAINGNLSLQDNAELSFVIRNTGAGEFDTLTVSGNTHFAGKLAVTLINGFVPQSGDSFTIVTSGTNITGAFANVANGSRIRTIDGRGSFVATYSDNHLVLSNYNTEPPHGLLNLSTRLRVLTGDDIAIGGFTITGTASKKVVIRGMGPSLAQQNLTGLLADPTIEVHTTDANGQDSIVGSNDNWQDDAAQVMQIQSKGLAPGNASESAIILTLAPGQYTTLLRGKNGGTGLGLVELYDVEMTMSAKVANLSTRGFVNTGDNVMIGGFIVGAPDISNADGGLPSGSATTTAVVVRGIGPSLPNSIANRLVDPFLTVHDANGNQFASNDDWQTDPNAASIQTANLAPTNSKESAVLLHLVPGPYTAILRGTSNSTGVGLVEIYRQ